MARRPKRRPLDGIEIHPLCIATSKKGRDHLDLFIAMNSSRNDGGGVDVQGSSPTFINCTIAGNSANLRGAEAVGGGVRLSVSSTGTFTNCIVWDNAGGLPIELQDTSTALVTFTITDDVEPMAGKGNLNTDPLFLAVDDYHLQPGSPAIDAGTADSAPPVDTEGNGRPCGEGVDLGAYERGGCPGDDVPGKIMFQRGNADNAGAVDIGDGVFVLNFLFLGGRAPVCADAADSDDSGFLDINDGVSLFNFLFLGGSPPPTPFPDCGADPTDDALDCTTFEICP